MGVAQLEHLTQLGPLGDPDLPAVLRQHVDRGRARHGDDERARARIGHGARGPREPAAGIRRRGAAAHREARGAARRDANDRGRDVHAEEPVRRVRRQQPRRARRRAAADPVRDPGRRRGRRPAARPARPAALGTRAHQRPDDPHRAFRACDRPVRRAGDDLQRHRQDRLGHRHCARRVRARLHRRDDAAPVRDDVAVAAVPGQAQPARDLAAAAPGAGDGILDQLERGDAADRAYGRARGSRRARAGRRASCCRSARP